MEKMNITTESIREYWGPISYLFSISGEEEYDRAIKFLNRLIDEVGTDDRHPLYGLLDALGTVIHSYEERHLSMPDCDAIEMLCHFMEEHGLEASDLPEIGSEEAVSDVISGRTELSVRQVRALADRFHVSPAVFI